VRARQRPATNGSLTSRAAATRRWRKEAAQVTLVRGSSQRTSARLGASPLWPRTLGLSPFPSEGSPRLVLKTTQWRRRLRQPMLWRMLSTSSQVNLRTATRVEAGADPAASGGQVTFKQALEAARAAARTAAQSRALPFWARV
jgi:hypothetical protein